jgi:ATP-dependent Clp protease adaptor protein ClpS
MPEIKLSLTMGDEQSEEVHGVAVAPSEPELEKPSMYQVVMLNDDYTPMDFVVEVLRIFFAMGLEGCTQIMMAVHTQGKAVCGTYTKDVAQTKAAQVMEFAKENEYPLMCDVQRIK